MKKAKNNQQPTIFDWLKKAEEQTRQSLSPMQNGSLDIDSELRAAVTEDLKHAIDLNSGREMSRYEVAARMSELVGDEITASMLYSWTADSKERHRFPCLYLPAFVLATGGQRRAFEVLSRRSGLFALPGREALRAEIQRIEEVIKKNKAEKHKRIIFLKEIEGGEG